MTRHGMLKRMGAGGFTLVELMIVTAIVAILARFAFLAYQSNYVKGNRSAAQAAMMDIAQKEQQYLLDARAYPATLAGLTAASVPASVSQYYTITAVSPNPSFAGTGPSFIITATPLAGTIQASDSVLTLDQTGAKTPSTVW